MVSRARDQKSLKRLELRTDYIETKVGSELSDLLAERMLAQGLPVPHPVTNAERQRIEIVRSLLREVASTAKSVEAAGGDLDKAANQAWICMKASNLIAEMLSFPRYKQFRDYEDGLKLKREQHGEKIDGRQHLIDLGEYIEKLADRISFEDIDTKAKLPLSFREYLKRK